MSARDQMRIAFRKISGVADLGTVYLLTLYSKSSSTLDIRAYDESQRVWRNRSVRLSSSSSGSRKLAGPDLDAFRERVVCTLDRRPWTSSAVSSSASSSAAAPSVSALPSASSSAAAAAAAATSSTAETPPLSIEVSLVGDSTDTTTTRRALEVTFLAPVTGIGIEGGLKVLSSTLPPVTKADDVRRSVKRLLQAFTQVNVVKTRAQAQVMAYQEDAATMRLLKASMQNQRDSLLDDLYAKFLVVLNEKHRRLSELHEENERLRRQLAASGGSMTATAAAAASSVPAGASSSSAAASMPASGAAGASLSSSVVAEIDASFFDESSDSEREREARDSGLLKNKAGSPKKRARDRRRDNGDDGDDSLTDEEISQVTRSRISPSKMQQSLDNMTMPSLASMSSTSPSKPNSQRLRSLLDSVESSTTPRRRKRRRRPVEQHKAPNSSPPDKPDASMSPLRNKSPRKKTKRRSRKPKEERDVLDALE